VNGTLVARPPRMTPVSSCAVGVHLDRRVKPVLGDNCFVGKPLCGAAAGVTSSL
jgi:hypothetical protein